MPEARRIVALVGPADVHEYRRLMRAVTELVAWRVRSGEAFDPEVDLHPDGIDYFVNRVCVDRSDGWRRDRQWVLGRIGRLVVPRLHPVKRRGVGASRGVDPYSVIEQEALLVIAGLACDLGRVEQGWLVVAALGAGLKGPEVKAARPGDVFDAGDGRLGVRVRGRHERVVPIRERYVQTAIAVVEASSGGPFIADGAPNSVHKIASRIETPRGLSLSLVRGRHTWLKAHLVAGTPLAALLRIAGPVSLVTCTQLLGSAAQEITDDTAFAQGLGP